MPHLPAEKFEHVMQPLVGKSIGFVRPVGNVGDRLIEMATFQLFETFGIRWRCVSPANVDGCDELAFGGGGNMGTWYEMNWDLRTECLQTGLPVTVLPQSFTTPEDRPFSRVYVRERESLKLHPSGILAPDLALGLRYSSNTRPKSQKGVFLRRDRESTRPRAWLRRLRRDPVALCSTPIEYLELAAQFRHIVTDRLHFAICGLLLDRRVTLVGNSYHKNASMHATWLRDMGCEFAESHVQAAAA